MIEHVVVVGGGIAGSAAALALRRIGIAVTVLETRPAINGGAVVRINPNGVDALRAVGADQPVIAASFPLIRFDWYDHRGRNNYRLTADPSGERGMPRVMAWARLAQVLHDEAVRAGAVIRPDAPVADVAESAGKARAVLADGEAVVGDVLIGADGTRSTVRDRIDPQAPEPQHLGSRTVYGFTPAQEALQPPPPEVLRAYVDPGFLAVTRDSFSGGCYWFTSLPAPQVLGPGEGGDLELWRARLVETISEQAAPVVRGADRILAFDDYALPHLPRWRRGRMLVLGDAAHVAPPASEQGAAMALEDGVTLAQCLRDVAEPGAALAAFQRIRQERAEAVAALGQASTRRAHARGVARLARRVRERLTRPGHSVRLNVAGHAWALDHHIDWERPVEADGEPEDRGRG